MHLQRSDHSPLARVQLSVGANDPEPDQTLDHKHKEREDTEPRGRFWRIPPDDTDHREHGRIERQEEGVGEGGRGAGGLGELTRSASST